VFNDASLAACAMPQGLPFITCRDSSGALLTLDPTKFDGAWADPDTSGGGDGNSQNVIMAVNLRTTYMPGVNLMPEAACNRAAYSPRYGGRCAANAIAYLAFDERYWSDPTFPAYGGCLAGGITRGIGLDVKADPLNPTLQTRFGTYRSWWTPPAWPWDLWFNLPKSQGSDAAAFVADQDKLNSLYIKQEPFKLPRNESSAGVTGGCWGWWLRLRQAVQVPGTLSGTLNHALPARTACTSASALSGCHRFRVTVGNSLGLTTWCMQGPTDAQLENGTWSGDSTGDRSAWVTHVRCEVSDLFTDPRQCFQVDGNLSASTGARVMYRGLCIGLVPGRPLSTQPGGQTDAIRLQPCSEGYNLWKWRSSYISVHVPGLVCEGPESSQPALCLTAWLFPGQTPNSKLIAVNTRILGKLGLSLFLTNGYASYTADAKVQGELRDGCMVQQQQAWVPLCVCVLPVD
jgi:hypothetical protein